MCPGVASAVRVRPPATISSPSLMPVRPKLTSSAAATTYAASVARASASPPVT